MPACNDCGVDIRWANNQRERKSKLEFLGTVLVVDDNNQIRQVAGYKFHICDDATITRFQEAKTRVVGDAATYELTLEQIWEAALPHPCPKCNVLAQEQCENLMKRKHGEKAFTVWPHAERIPEPVRVQLRQEGRLM